MKNFCANILMILIGFFTGFIICACIYTDYYTVQDIKETETGYLIEYTNNTGYYFEKGN